MPSQPFTAPSRYFALALFALLAFGIWQAFKPHPTAPNSVFTTITGSKINLQQLRGKAVLVTFWASDCPICIDEIPHLVDLYQQFRSKGLEIIAVQMPYDPPLRAVQISQSMQIPYPIALDLQGQHSREFGGINGTPSTFLISPQGLIVQKILGAFAKLAVQNRIQQLLQE